LVFMVPPLPFSPPGGFGSHVFFFAHPQTCLPTSIHHYLPPPPFSRRRERFHGSYFTCLCLQLFRTGSHVPFSWPVLGSARRTKFSLRKSFLHATRSPVAFTLDFSGIPVFPPPFSRDVPGGYSIPSPVWPTSPPVCVFPGQGGGPPLCTL